ncbi:transcriptional antiterminator RfaH [Haloferula luteola]|uniref:Transcriptional antiterminator RfaH n=1 Tax=Haloferula luteola TaxID=595692 RepID=A0A840VA15_9BACT|nr:transcriptional antiterminator RfaH [Haloferula luteola]
MKTAPKREHLAAGHLRELEGVEVFCPRLRYRKATRRGKIWWVEAMFPGYLLARFDLAEKRRHVEYAQGVTGLVKFGQQVPEIATAFVEALRREVREREVEEGPDETLTLIPKIAADDEVEVAHGPLGGFHGRVVEVLPGRERVRVLMDFLGQPQVVEVDLFSLLLPSRPHP